MRQAVEYMFGKGMKPPAHDPSTWYALRDLVLDTAYTKRISVSPEQRTEFPELVGLLEEYLRTGKDKPIDLAAQYVARLWPGVTPEAASRSAWLFLLKS